MKALVVLIRVLWRFTGLLAVLLGWCTIALSLLRNPWFRVFEHALSDLGGLSATDPWIYSTGLMVTGSMASLYALYLAYTSRSKASVYASSFLFIAGVFLVLIGVFPSGTRPHVFVSTWFFVQTWMAMATSTVDFLIRREKVPGFTLLILTVLGPTLALVIDWPSVALLEIYGVVIINVYIAVLTARY